MKMEQAIVNYELEIKQTLVYVKYKVNTCRT